MTFTPPFTSKGRSIIIINARGTMIVNVIENLCKYHTLVGDEAGAIDFEDEDVVDYPCLA